MQNLQREYNNLRIKNNMKENTLHNETTDNRNRLSSLATEINIHILSKKNKCKDEHEITWKSE